jgi:hypothetical protein
MHTLSVDLHSFCTEYMTFIVGDNLKELQLFLMQTIAP